jgi:hypothetical protein
MRAALDTFIAKRQDALVQLSLEQDAMTDTGSPKCQ